MKKKFSSFAALTLRVTIITGCIMYGFSVNAQSIAGKWKMTDAKETITDKATGQKQDIAPQVKEVIKMVEQIIEFRSDNTYFTSNTMKGNTKGFEGSGTYSISGKEITLHQDKSNVPVTNSKYALSNVMNKLPNTMTIVSQTGNTLILHYGAETNADGKNMAVDIEDTFEKQ